MTNHGDGPSGDAAGPKRSGPRFVPPVPGIGEAQQPSVSQPPADAPRDQDLFRSRYVPFDGPSAKPDSSSTPVVARPSRSPNSSRSGKVTGSRYVPIDGTGALYARPSTAVLTGAGIAASAAVALAVFWGANSDSDGLTAGTFAAVVAGALALVALGVWKFGTARMAAVSVITLGSLFTIVAAGAVLLSSPDAPTPGTTTAIEDDFDLLYGRCQQDSDIACDLLYAGSWENSIRSSLAQEMRRDCGGRNTGAQQYCTMGLTDGDLDGFADADADGWDAVTRGCEQANLFACDLAATLAPVGSPVQTLGESCGSRASTNVESCRSLLVEATND